MPESEPKPKLIELVAPGAGQGWKAVLRNGKPAVVHEIPVPPAEAQASVPRLQRLYDHRHPALSPVLAWGTDQQGVWVAVEPNEGTPLGSILSRGPLTPPAAAALGAAVLSGVAALHEAGVAMGGFGATAVRITQNGDVRLAGHPAAAVRGAPSQSDLRADVRSSGMAVCAAFGVDPAGAPAPQNIPPGLVVTMRSMASGAMGPSADRAQGAFREMAAALLAPDRQVAAQTELATRAGGREVPPITPFLPQEEKPAAAVAPAPPVVPPAPIAPTAPYTPAGRREETPVRRPASYDAPDRPLQTYPAMPAVTFPPAPAPAAPAASAAPAAPAEPRPASPSVPTWAEAPPRTPASPFDNPEAATASTSTPEPAAPVEAPLPAWTAPPEPRHEPAPTSGDAAAPPSAPPAPAPVEPPKPPAWQPVEPPAWKPGETIPPETLGTGVAAAAEAAAPAAPPPPPPPPSPAPVEPPPKPAWQPLEQPSWKPGETIPPETLGTGVAAASAPAPAPPAPAPPAPEPAPIRPPTAPVRKPTVARPPSRGGPTFERPPWLVPAAVAVVIVLLLGIFGVIVLSRRGGPSNNVAQTTPSAHASASATAKSTPSASPTGKAPQTVPTYGPASADPITKVQFCTTANPCKIAVGVADETATNCSLTTCTIEAALYFSGPQHSPVHYNLKFFDRCSGQTTDLPGPPAYSPPGYAVVIPRDHWQVNIPSGVKSGALVALSDQPSTAASAPLLLGSETC